MGAAVKQYRDREGAVSVSSPMNHPANAEGKKGMVHEMGELSWTLPDRSLTVAVLTGAAVKPYRDREGAVFANLPMNHPAKRAANSTPYAA